MVSLAIGCRSSSIGSNTTAAPEPRLASAAPFDIAYRNAMPDPASHFFDVTINVANMTDDVVRLQMPVWSPGRYARNDRGNLPTHSQLQIISGHETVSAHGDHQRLQRSVSAFSGLLRLVPKFPEEPNFGMKIGTRLLSTFLCTVH